MNQVEGQQKNLVHAIESLPGSGPLTALDQDLLLLKATSAATLSCLGECLTLLQQSVRQAGPPSHKPGASGECFAPSPRACLLEMGAPLTTCVRLILCLRLDDLRVPPVPSRPFIYS